MAAFLIILLAFNVIQLSLARGDPINYIIDNIYLGDVKGAKDEKLLKSYNITHVVNCADDHTSRYKDLKHIQLKMKDSSSQKLFPLLEEGYEYIKENSKGDNNIFVHCQAGMSRSGAMVIFYVMKAKGWDFETSYAYVKEKRSVVKPNHGFRKQLQEYSDKYIKKKDSDDSEEDEEEKKKKKKEEERKKKKEEEKKKKKKEEERKKKKKKEEEKKKKKEKEKKKKHHHHHHRD
jgi:protein-tyrosine phosphatase